MAKNLQVANKSENSMDFGAWHLVRWLFQIAHKSKIGVVRN